MRNASGHTTGTVRSLWTWLWDSYCVSQNAFLVFTALHGMQTRSCDELSVRLSVRPSVCLSVKRVHCDKTEESYVEIYHMKEHLS